LDHITIDGKCMRGSGNSELKALSCASGLHLPLEYGQLLQKPASRSHGLPGRADTTWYRSFYLRHMSSKGRFASGRGPATSRRFW
jgi:hypothetical protein